MWKTAVRTDSRTDGRSGGLTFERLGQTNERMDERANGRTSEKERRAYYIDLERKSLRLMDGVTVRQANRRTDRQTRGQMNRKSLTDGQMDRGTDGDLAYRRRDRRTNDLPHDRWTDERMH